MTGKFPIFSLYRFEASPSALHLLIRTEMPNYRNGSQVEENWAYATETQQRQSLLQQYREVCGLESPSFLGELAGFPSADMLYDPKGNIMLSVFYQPTACGFPYIILDAAETPEQYAELLTQNEDFQALEPCDEPIHLQVFLVVQS